MSTSPSTRAIRLAPGTDVREYLEQYCRDKKIDAAALVTMVGSLETAAIRMANAPEPTVSKGPFEIVSAVGTLSADGVHIHVSLSDREGKVFGGHLSKGCKVYTTMEIVLLDISKEWSFQRAKDPKTGDLELKCTPKFED